MSTPRAMSRCGAALIGCVALWASPGTAWGQDAPADNCRTCHGSLTGRLGEPAHDFPNDIHATRGFGCVACHGGDATAPGLSGMDAAKGFLAKPAGPVVLQVCGRCHADAGFMRRYNPSIRVDQLAEYQSSVHGQRLAELADTSVATCVSCHPAHDIRPPSDPLSSVHPQNVPETCGQCHADPTRMASYGLSTDQLEQYQQSVHWQMLTDGGDLSAPTCNDCHGNHGAAPPGVDWVGNVCGQCHSVMADYFRTSPHARIFAMLGVPGCATCHGNHGVSAVGDEFLGLGEGAACARCHVEGAGGGVIAAAMRSQIDTLQAEHGTADSLLRLAEDAGVEVSNALFELGGAQNALIQARAAVHAFHIDSVAGHVTAGREITTAAIGRGHDALGELRFRRTGLAVSVTIILAVIAGLILKIKEIEG